MADGGQHLSPEAAAIEVLRRRRARAHLDSYSQSITIPGAPMSDDPDEWIFKPIETAVAKHHIVTMRAIEKCIRTDYGRLMIFEPPGSAKSTYGSVVAPSWAMGAFPGVRVLMTSYAATPIIRHSKRCRQILASREYTSIWETETRLVEGSSAADEFELTNGSGLFATGLLGAMTSVRCDVGIIDDPVAGREEAESETMRIKTLAAYEDDFLTRLKPKASIIIISTRWHQDDLPGCILPEDYDGRSGPVLCRDGQVWEVLNIQAKCELADDPVGRQISEYLWPEWFGAPHWAMYERNARTWASLYQQRPSPQEGIYFKRENFRRYDGLDPPDLRYYMASDFAVKEQKDKTKHGTPDFSEHGMFGTQDVKVDGFNEQRVFITDWWSGQVESDESIDAALDMIANRPVKKRPGLWFGELGVIEHAIGPQIRTRMRQRKVFIGRELLPSIVDKVARCAAFIGMVNAQVVYVKVGQWGDELIDQLCSFPAGRYDDKVDVCGMFGRGLDLVISGKRPRPAAKKSWRDKLRAHYGKQRSPMTS
jgi:predicted phage terminase large subunit-like protein